MGYETSYPILQQAYPIVGPSEIQPKNVNAESSQVGPRSNPNARLWLLENQFKLILWFVMYIYLIC